MAEPTRPPKRRKPDEDREIDYLICGHCNTPCYIFDMDGSRIVDATCLVCGNDNITMFNVGEEAGSEDA
ncbi:MAG TPA: hypothetical protein VER78_05540 [Thermoanaerobaculia bacterium]|nr:hypothetical protein [Thermoanaerobaculia bacterium]